MKVKLIELVSEAHGKMCKRDGSPVFALNSATGTQYVYHTHKVNARIANPTSNQVNVQNKFANTWDLIKAAKQDADQWSGIVSGFRNQSKYKTLNGYAFATLYKTASTTRS